MDVALKVVWLNAINQSSKRLMVKTYIEACAVHIGNVPDANTNLSSHSTFPALAFATP